MAREPASWPRDALPAGTDLNGYRIEEVIGRGGFGITYRAVDALDQVFAIKECFPKQFAVRQAGEVYASDQEAEEPYSDCLSRFGQEAKALRKLAALGAAGEGVVKVATYFPANGTAYVVMEYLDGDSLEKVIRAARQGLPAAQLEDMVPRLLHAIGCVHTAGLLHRDIKPGNIILRQDGRPVLIDFGAARTSSHGRTVTFTQIFSEGYAPIEQFAGTKQGPFSDIYALGATLYRAIGGTTIDSFTRHQALLRGKADPQTKAVEVGAGRYEPRLLAAIDAAMVVAPEERPQTVAGLLALFDRDSLEGATVVAPRFERPTEPSAPAPAPITTSNPSPKLVVRSPIIAQDAPPDAEHPWRLGWRVLALTLFAVGAAAALVIGVFIAGMRSGDAKNSGGTSATLPTVSSPLYQPAKQSVVHIAVDPVDHDLVPPTPAPPSQEETDAKARAAKAKDSTSALILFARTRFDAFQIDAAGFPHAAMPILNRGNIDFDQKNYADAEKTFSDAQQHVIQETRQVFATRAADALIQSQKDFSSGYLAAAESGLNAAKRYRNELNSIQLSNGADDQASQLIDMESAAFALLNKNMRSVTGLGIKPNDFFFDVNPLFQQAQKEVDEGSFAEAISDYGRASNMVRTETRTLLTQELGAFSGMSKNKLKANDFAGAQGALDKAKKIQQAIDALN